MYLHKGELRPGRQSTPVQCLKDQLLTRCLWCTLQSCSNYNLVYVSFLINFGYGQNVADGLNLAFHSIAATGPEITQARHPCASSSPALHLSTLQTSSLLTWLSGMRCHMSW